MGVAVLVFTVGWPPGGAALGFRCLGLVRALGARTRDLEGQGDTMGQGEIGIR